VTDATANARVFAELAAHLARAQAGAGLDELLDGLALAALELAGGEAAAAAADDEPGLPPLVFVQQGDGAPPAELHQRLAHALEGRPTEGVVVVPLAIGATRVGGLAVRGGDASAAPQLALLAAGAVHDVATARTAWLQSTDPLTRLPARAWLAPRIPGALDAATRGRLPLSIALLELEGLRGVNAEHGAEAGDALLREVARRVKGALRSQDLAARWGADVLLVLAPGADATASAKLLARLSSAVSSSEASVARARLSPVVRCGAGVARVGDDVEALLHRAERALARARQSRRSEVEA